MKTRSMREIDGIFGPFLCRLLSLFFRRKRPLPKEVKKVLIVKMFGLGSMILMTPMIRSIRKSHPRVKIYFMSFAEHEAIAKAYGLCDCFMVVRRDSLLNFIMDSLRNVRRVKEDRVDIVIDAEFFAKYTAIFSSLCRFSYLIGFYNRDLYRGRFLDRRCYFNQYYHMKQNFIELANVFCAPYTDTSLSLPEISKDATKRIVGLIKERHPGDQSFVILNPNTSDMTPAIDRNWPLENFAEVGRHLMKKGYGIVVIGGSKQTVRADKLVRMCGGDAISFAGKTDMEELIALIRESFCLITNDSGPLHIAASLNVPTMTFFGTDTPTLYGAEGPSHTAFFKNIPCSPCLSVFNYKKGECEFASRCIREITVQEVIAAFDTKERLVKDEFADRAR